MVKVLAEQKGAKQEVPIRLQQLKGGSVLSVIVGQNRKVQREAQVKSETGAKIKKKLRLSHIATKTVCNILREDDVRVELGTRKFLSEVDQLLHPY